ncbi:MAG: C40 family peptidase [Clostridia bacterium]|nr:C40 family peptidase [Clostridia bacterium]
MKQVKQKPVMRDVRTRDPASRIPQTAGRMAEKMKSRIREVSSGQQEPQQHTPEEYAEEKAHEIGRDSFRTVRSSSRFVREKLKRPHGSRPAAESNSKGTFMSDAEQESLPDPFPSRETTDNPGQATVSMPASPGRQRYAQILAKRKADLRRIGSTEIPDLPGDKSYLDHPVPPVKQVPERTFEAAQKNLKRSDRSVKTGEHVAKEAEKTIKTLDRNQSISNRAAKSAKAKAIQKTERSKKTTKKAATSAAKAIKAAWEAVKKLVLTLAGGSTFLLVAVAVMAVMTAILLSAFGIFWSNDSGEGNPMTAVVRSIDTEYRSAIDARIAELSSEEAYDEVRVIYRGDNDGDSASVNNWNDVLGIYAVLHSDDSSAVPVITVTEDTESELREIFYSMNAVGFEKEILVEDDETAPEPTPDPEGNVPEKQKKTVACIYVTQSSESYREAAERLGFTEQEREVLEELMSPAYYTMFAALVGVDVYGGADLTQIVSGLPANSKGAEVVKAALTKLGAPYVWGAKGESKFDCSGLSYWSIRQVDPSLGGKMYTNAAGQAKYCSDRGLLVGASELQPGDLVFWQNLRCSGCHRWNEVHHVGIYAGNSQVVEASSSKGRVVIRDLWSTANYPIFAYGRPYGN